MRTVLSVRSAAELARVGEPAIRRAIREDRLDAPLVFYVGERHTSWVDLGSLVAVYRLSEQAVADYFDWLASIKTAAPTVTTAGGEWRLVDRGDVFHEPTRR